MPSKAKWIKHAASGFEPDKNTVNLVNGTEVTYQQLIICPGLPQARERIEGLEETLGKKWGDFKLSF